MGTYTRADSDGNEMWKNLTGSGDGTGWLQPLNAGCLGVQVDLTSLMITGFEWGGRDGVPLLDA